MAVKDVSGTQGSFVSRTKSLDIQQRWSHRFSS